SVRLWDYPSQSSPRTLIAFPQPFYFIAVSADGKRVATSDRRAEEIQLWDIEKPDKAVAIFKSTRIPYCDDITFSPDGNLLAGGGYGCVEIWDVKTQQPVVRLYGQGMYPRSFTFSPDGKWLAVGSFGGVRLWELAVWIQQ